MIAARGPLWARPHDFEDESLSLGRAALIALGIECIVPLLVLGINWSFLPTLEETVIPVMSVRLEEPPPETAAEPPPPPPKVKPREQEQPKPVKKQKLRVPIELPKPLPNEVPSRIVLPKPEPDPVPVPKEEKKPEPELPPLPSVYRDVKPVRKVKPVYPPEAEAQHIQGRVKVRLTVNVEGAVTDVQVLASEPAGVFDEAVLTAVRQYVFKNGGTRYQADQEIVFKIDD
jgi:protein TonB